MKKSAQHLHTITFSAASALSLLLSLAILPAAVYACRQFILDLTTSLPQIKAALTGNFF